MTPGAARRVILRRAISAFVVIGLPGVLSTSVRADMVLHEYIPEDAAEDLRLAATTSDGAMPAAIETRSGAVSSPDAERSTGAGRERRVYGAGGADARGTGSGPYRIDSDTSRPDRVGYEDPFTPAVTPYKREVAYDGVNDAFELVLRDPALVRLPVGGTAASGDDQFYGDLDVSMDAGTPVRIPAVGPGARLLGVRAVPRTDLQFFRDGGDNWFVKSESPGSLRLVLHLAIDRAVFGSPFATVEWASLRPLAASVPEGVRREGVAAARQIGVVDGTGPAEAVAQLVGYFRGFAPSEDHPAGAGAELYRALVQSKKGVCRHRAYAFVVTALALGLPARFVRNEAHAWVEVTDGVRFHRIDLGGAAGDVDFSAEGVAHVPPRDPYAWPLGEDSGQAMAGRARAAQSSSGSGTASRSGSSGAHDTGPLPTPSEESAGEPGSRAPASTLTVSLAGSEAMRGARLRVSGLVTGASGPCAEVRVDLLAEPLRGAGVGEKPGIPLGTLVTNAEGRYDGRIVVPFSVPPGDYGVRATTPGGTLCGPGRSP